MLPLLWLNYFTSISTKSLIIKNNYLICIFCSKKYLVIPQLPISLTKIKRKNFLLNFILLSHYFFHSGSHYSVQHSQKFKAWETFIVGLRSMCSGWRRSIFEGKVLFKIDKKNIMCIKKEQKNPNPNLEQVCFLFPRLYEHHGMHYKLFIAEKQTVLKS